MEMAGMEMEMEMTEVVSGNSGGRWRCGSSAPRSALGIAARHLGKPKPGSALEFQQPVGGLLQIHEHRAKIHAARSSKDKTAEAIKWDARTKEADRYITRAN
jgi:hypothetical protein